jgi:hypothetical protein
MTQKDSLEWLIWESSNLDFAKCKASKSWWRPPI